MALTPSETIRGPFERIDEPGRAVDRLAQLYEEAAHTLRTALERFLKTGEPPLRKPAPASAIPNSG